MDNVKMFSFSFAVALFKQPVSREFVRCSCVVIFFLLYFVVGFVVSVVSMFVLNHLRRLVFCSGVDRFYGSGVVCSKLNLLLVTSDGDVKDNSDIF